MNEIVAALFLIGGAVVAATLCVLALASGMHWGRDRECGLVPYLFYPTVAFLTFGVMMSGRDLALDPNAAIVTSNNVPLLGWISKAVSLALLGVSGERILHRLLQLEPRSPVPVGIGIALAFFYLTNVVSGALLGRHPSFSTEYLYTVVAAWAALLITQQEGDTAVRSMRNVLFIFLMISAGWVLWRPDMVLSHDYRASISGLGARYAGLTNGPNSLGPVVIVFLLCLWVCPYRRYWINVAGWIGGGVSLLFSQSKTSWMALVVCIACMAYYRQKRRIAGQPGSCTPRASSAILLLMMPLVSLAFAMTFLLGGWNERIDAFFRGQIGSDLLTFVGRSQIWDIAMQEWRNNPVFGYGLTIWSPDYRARIGLPDATDAHNQFFQSLSSTGLIGVTGLAVYVGVLFWFSVRTAAASAGLSIALFFLMMIRSVSEVALTMTGYGFDQLTHLLLLMTIASHFSQLTTVATTRTIPRTPSSYVSEIRP